MAAASYWRVKGLSYLQYLSIGSNVVRNALKEPLKTEALKRSKVHYAMSAWADGTQGPVGKFKNERASVKMNVFCFLFASTICGYECLSVHIEIYLVLLREHKVVSFLAFSLCTWFSEFTRIRRTNTHFHKLWWFFVRTFAHAFWHRLHTGAPRYYLSSRRIFYFSEILDVFRSYSATASEGGGK